AHPPGHGQFPCASTTEKERKDQKRKRIASLRSLGAKHGSALENVRARKTVEGGVGRMAGV
ncbi:hypothetical protein, partial [Stenotrophomonas maltophilia]|uniref:hypothetical protein n=1 Tax=Stenotrophomonas maltophilia TaxID=40324 RepID=UPI001A7E120F